MKKLIALLLALTMVLALAACGNKAPAATEAPVATDAPIEDETPATYTYRSALTTFPTNWNPHTYQTSTDNEILGNISTGFYTFDYNETMDGYKIVPEMASDFPIDVTADYVGQFGIAEGDEAKAWIIPLRDDLKWEDGTPIVANDFIESAKRLLNPAAQNYRADSLYSGNMVIVNAQDYLYGGTAQQLENGTNAGYEMADLSIGDDGIYVTPDGGKVYIAIEFPLANWLGGRTLKYYVEGYGDAYFDVTNWDALCELVDGNGLIPLTEEVYELFVPIIAGNPAWGESEAEVPNYLVYDFTYPEMAWEEVGMRAISDNELLIAIAKPLSGFYLYYSLTDSWLVKTDLYDSLESIVDGVYSNTYGTSVDTIMSYGPFKLTSFQADKQYTFERNDNYFGKTEDNYQVTNWIVDMVPEAPTRLELFLQGKLDGYALQSEDMGTYSLSDYCYYSTGDSTFAMVFNPDFDALVEAQANAGANINKTIITVPEFRIAMSYALDRDAFCLATSPTNAAAFGLFSSLIVSDPDAGTAYRTTEVAKNTLAKFWGVSEEYGEGKLYADLDEAVDSITGYNLTKAKEMFDKAYDIAIEQGLMTENDTVEIKIGTPNNTSNFYNKGYDFLVNNYTEAVKGTKLEGKMTFPRDDTLGNGFSDALKNNQVDMLFGVGWTGSALDPYGLIEAYIMTNYQYDDSFDYNSVIITINVNGEDYTGTAIQWYDVMMGEGATLTKADGSEVEYSCGTADEDPITRLYILGAMEEAVLLNYNFIPIMDDASASLKSQKIEFATEEYIFGMGFGGLKYYTFNFTDAEWDAYVAENGGELDYT